MNKYWLILLLPGALLLWWGLDHDGSGPQIHFDAARYLTIESTVSTNGKVEPAEWAAARAETSGIVRSVYVQRGQTVTAGQVLVTLDTTAAQTDLAAAEAQEQEARAELNALTQGGKAAVLADLNDKIKSAQAALDIARRNYESLQRLYASQAATKVQLEDAKDAVQRASLQLTALEDQRRNLVTASDKTVAEAKLRNAEAAVALARHQIALGTIRAPISGTVYEFDLNVVSYLEPGKEVAFIGRLDQVKVTVYVDEPDLGRVAVGMPVTITWDALPGREWKGAVEKTPTAVIPLGTRQVGEVTCVIDNPDHDLLPGTNVNAEIRSKVAENVLTIPKSAVRRDNGQTGVFLLDGDRVRWRPVTLGVASVARTEVSGLNQGDSVALPSDRPLKNGMLVTAVYP